MTTVPAVKQLTTNLTRSPAKAAGLAVIHFMVLVTGMAIGSAKYDDWDFAARYVPTLAVATALLATVTLLIGSSRREMGLRAPQRHDLKLALPAVLIVAAGATAFALTWANLPDGASFSGSTMVRTFLATAMVGFTEEWMYRGLLLTVMIGWLGFRNGALLSAAAFGVFHIGNVVAGAPLAATGKQVVFTAVLGLTFMLVALATRSVIPGMIAHALYDFFLLGMEQLAEAGAEKSLVAGPVTLVVGIIAAVVAIRHVTATNEIEPYPAR